jgi:protein-disulfide isomerase-like protein with CxxC motif
MTQVTYLFDPRSPWCYQTSRWLRKVADAGKVELSWGVVSLEIMNLKTDKGEDPHTYDAEYAPALRVALALRERVGQDAIGDFYDQLGKLMWETDVPTTLSMTELTHQAAALVGVSSQFVDDVLADPLTWEAVLTEHERWTKTLKAFGVPTMVFGSDETEHAVFGPVLQELPDDETSLELWTHVSALLAHGTVYEVKRNKPHSLRAVLPAADWRAEIRIADMRAARALMAEGGPHEGASMDWAMATVRASRAQVGVSHG